MHNNYYFLRQLTKSLEPLIAGAVISECFSQSKEELVIRFERKDSPFYIKAALLSSFSCLSFPFKFDRARKNSVDLFQKLIGQRVVSLHQSKNERSFTIGLSNEFSLLFKMHGNRSNVIAFQSNAVDEIFKNSIIEDQALDVTKLDGEIDWSYENFVKHHEGPESVYFTFGKVVWKYIKAQHYNSLTIDEKWKCIQSTLDKLNDPTYSIREANGKYFFSLVDLGTLVKQYDDPIKAVNDFYIFYTQQEAFSREKLSAASMLRSKLTSIENYITKTENKLRELETDNNYKVWADLLMANLHVIQQGSERVTLSDFYHDNRPTDIKLKRDLSPQKNAAIFYKKAKNQQIEIDHLLKLLRNRRSEKALLDRHLHDIEATTDLKTLRSFTSELKISGDKEKQAPLLPYREVEFNGYKIWIGKNAQSNDTLTLKYGYKEDLWLHAKDVAGSHVLIKYQSGKTFPKDVIERAAQLAAYYSKRKNESLCPVAMTSRKYVRKRKGDPPGMVVVEREEVIMVEPTN